MCTPSLAISAGLQIGGQYSAQQSQARMTRMRNAAATESAQSALDLDQDILLRQAGEQRTRFAQAGFDRAVRARELAAQAVAQAGEAGVAGRSVEAQQRKVAFQEGQATVRAEKSFDSVMESIRDTNTKAISNMTARLNSLPAVNTPNLLATSLSVGANYLTGQAADQFDGWFESTFSRGTEE